MTRTHDTIAADTEAFLRNGGAIQKAPMGKSQLKSGPGEYEYRDSKSAMPPLSARQIYQRIRLNMNISCSESTIAAIMKGTKSTLAPTAPDRLCAIVARIMDSDGQPVTDEVRKRAERWNAVPVEMPETMLSECATEKAAERVLRKWNHKIESGYAP